MRIRLLFSLVLIGTGLLASCKKEDSTPPTGSIHFEVSNEVSGQPVNMGPISYTNAAGNQYGISLLKYYLSNFTLVKKDGSEQHFPMYKLINAAEPGTLNFTLDSVLNGEYTSIRFYVGVDSQRNHTGAQDGDLDPIHGMIWTWNTGYIFFKHEGDFRDTSGAVRRLVQHLGMDMSLATVTIPLGNLQISGAEKHYTLHFDLNKVYSGLGGTVNFNDEPVRMSDPHDDSFWMITLKNNFDGAFTIGN